MMSSTLYAEGSWLALFSFGMQVACALVICLGHFIPFSISLSILVSHRSGVSVSLLSVTSSHASGPEAFFLTCLNASQSSSTVVCGQLFVLSVHVLSAENSEVLENLFVRPVGAIVNFCPRPRHEAVSFYRVGV